MTKTTNRPRRSLLKNTRGSSEFTSAIILTVALALGCLAAVQALKGQIGTKLQQTGQAIQAVK